MEDKITLVFQSYTKDSINQQRATEKLREIWCRVDSISRSEWSAASMQGLKPELMIITPRCNYCGEKVAIWRGKRYAIYRTYYDSSADEIELYLSQEVGA